MLECCLGEEQVTVKTTRGCPQGGVLSPLLWSFVIDKLLNDLDRQGFEVIGFADDLVITVRRTNSSILSERMQSALNYVIG
jgi:retron-type reverse transcriptase